MALPRLATTDDLEARLGVTLTGDDLRRAEALLDDASALIRAETELDWLDDLGHLEAVPEIVQSICLAVAGRGYRNPQGAAQTSVGDVSLSYGRTPPDTVWLTDAELRALHKLGGSSGFRSVALVTPWAVEADLYYVPVDIGGDPIPLGPWPWEV